MNDQTIRELMGLLFKGVPEAEASHAVAHFRRYLEGTLRRYDEMCADPARYAQLLALTGKRRVHTMKLNRRPANSQGT